MARQFELGLKYFPIDVGFFETDKIATLNLEYGILGESVFLRILTDIYRNGYFYEMDLDILAKHVIRRIGNKWTPPVDEIKQAILYMGEIGLFDLSFLRNGILTSREIQTQFIMSSRRKKGFEKYKHWLLSDPEVEEIKEFMKANRMGHTGASLPITDSQSDTVSRINDPLTQINHSVTQNNSPQGRLLQQKKKKKKKKEIKRIN